jgi:hypothetical protein
MALSDILKGKTAQEIESIAGYLADGVEAAAGLTGNADLEIAGDIVSGVDKLLKSLIAGVQGTISADEVRARISPLQSQIAGDNTAEDAAAAAKFGQGT